LNPRGIDGRSAEDVRKAALGRENFYAFLSRLYAREVDEEMLKTIIATQPTINFLASSQETQEFEKGNAILQEFVSHAKTLKGKEIRNLITDLRVEYAAMFLAVGKPLKFKGPLLTSESAYLGDHGASYYDKPFDVVKDTYSSAGFEKRKDFLEPEDHVAIELEYMANLSRQTYVSLDERKPDSASGYLKLQKEFLRDHLLRWVPKLCEGMKDLAESKLYQSLAFLTEGFILMDEQVVDELTKALR